MGTDYTLACIDCKKAAYADRHPRTFVWGRDIATDMVIEWNELDYPEPIPHKEPVPVLTMALLEECEDEYREDRGGPGIFAEMVDWVREHDGHRTVILSDGWGCSRDLTRAEGWERVDLTCGPVQKAVC